MNDRLKFRCYNCKTKKMYEVDSLHLDSENEWVWVHYYNPIYDKDLKIQIETPNAVLMQSTGLKDKNGKLIYEGDIVNQIYEDETIYKCEVVYNNCSFQLKHIEDKNKNYINTPMYCYAINYLGHYTEKRLEVIGNIYENKEDIK